MKDNLIHAQFTKKESPEDHHFWIQILASDHIECCNIDVDSEGEWLICTGRNRSEPVFVALDKVTIIKLRKDCPEQISLNKRLKEGS